MSGETRRKLEEIFARATEKGSAEERAAYLDGACGDDADLRDRVEALLRAHDRAGTFLESPAVSPDAGEGPGTRIGPYKLLQRIGEGGFGAVYMADQLEPVRRRVALKIIKFGMDTKQVIARFEAERQALALLDHPNIAKVLDAGAIKGGRPYFVMELVRGVSLTEYCDKNHLPARERLALFVQICNAVQHAHQKGIIHRDLKPTNVLVTLHDGTPVPMVIDFGIARATNRQLTEKTLFTEYGQFIGTPVYMSPEQAEMSGLDIDTRSDIYSLGVILYELLTGTTPLDEKELRRAGFLEIQRIIREEEPPIPSTRVSTLGDRLTKIAKSRRVEPSALSRLIRGDLDWIVMRAVEKDRTRRYASASEMAADVQRYLAREPILAGPPSVVYKLRKFVQRHRVGVVAGLLVAAALLTGLGLATAGFLKARREAARSQKIADFLQDLLLAADPEGSDDESVDVAAVSRTAREVFGDDHATVAATLTGRGSQLLAAADYTGAESLYREALRIWRDVYGEDHLTVGVALVGLGRALDMKGDDRAAEEAFREALRLTASLPEDRTVVQCEARVQLAVLVLNRGDHEEAEALLREAWRIRKTYAPHQKIQIALNLNSLVTVLVMEGKIEEAKPLSLELVASFRRAVPPRGTFLAKTLGQIGEFLRTSGEPEQAEPLFAEAVEIYREHPEAPVLDRFVAQRGLFKILMGRRDDSAELVRLGQEFVSTTRDLLGGTNADLLSLVGDFAGRLIEIERPLEGLAPVTDAVAALTESGCEDDRRDRTLKLLANLVWAVAKVPDRPREEYEKALAAALLYLEVKPNVAPVLNTQGVVLYRLGRYHEALEVLARSDAMYSATHEGGVPEDVAFIAMAHHRRGDEKEAKDAFERLRRLMEKPENSGDEDKRAFFEEARRLLETEESD